MTVTNCSVAGCEKLAKSRGWCQTHYTRWWKHGSPHTLHTRERGEGHLRYDGYVTIQRGGKKNLAHRWVMEDFLGRPLRSDETIHHRDGNRQNNSLDNLELWSKSQPAGQRVEDKLRWAYEIIARYGDPVPPERRTND